MAEPTETAIAKYEFHAASPIGSTENVKLMLRSDRMRQGLLDILPGFSDETDPQKHIERLIAQAGLAIMQNPKLKQCTQLSFFDSMMHVAETGLSLSRQSGEAYLVPFRDNRAGVTNCTFMPGYRGIIKLAHQTGGVRVVDGFAVYESEVDDFKVWEDETGTHLIHKPNMDDQRDDKDIRYVVARIQLATGGRIVKVMNRAEVERIRKGSKNADGTPWLRHWGEMAIKTVIKRALKTVPQSTTDKAARILARAIDLDNAAGGFIDVEAIEADIEAKQAAKQAQWAAAVSGDKALPAEPPIGDPALALEAQAKDAAFAAGLTDDEASKVWDAILVATGGDEDEIARRIAADDFDPRSFLTDAPPGRTAIA